MTRYSDSDGTLDKKEELMPAPNLFGAVYRRGIICPYNQDEHGPAKLRLQCLIWADYNQYWNLGEDAQRFCRTVCHYGKNYAQQRSQVKRSEQSFNAEKWQQFQTVKRWDALKQWWQRPWHPRQL